MVVVYPPLEVLVGAGEVGGDEGDRTAVQEERQRYTALVAPEALETGPYPRVVDDGDPGVVTVLCVDVQDDPDHRHRTDLKKKTAELDLISGTSRTHLCGIEMEKPSVLLMALSNKE